MAEPDSVRASDSERDAAASRLQVAFAEGRLGDTEFDERMRAALTATTRTDLARLTADLPADAPAPLPVPAGREPGRFAVTFKSSLRRAGRWRVPERLTTVVYKGEGLLDLRAAELTAPVTTISSRRACGSRRPALASPPAAPTHRRRCPTTRPWSTCGGTATREPSRWPGAQGELSPPGEN